MSFKSVIKKLGGLGAKTLVAGLQIGGGKVGRLAASAIADALDLDASSSDFSQRVSELLDTEDGQLAIKKAEHNYKLKTQQNLNEAEKVQLDDGIKRFEQSQISYREELRSKDSWIARTRPYIIRELFKLAKTMVYSLIVCAFLDIITDWVLMNRCTADGLEVIQGCWDFIKERKSFSVRLSVMYKDNWLWLSPLFGIFITWFGGRTWEKKHGLES